ncbi:MAG: ABC transporter permease [Oscillospiraceae bacterium]|nr:ABC transporter permease [Oscillospiraceae bacterium]
MKDLYADKSRDELFYFIDRDEIASEKITAPRYSYWKSVFRVFFRKKINIALIALFILIFAVSFIGPIFWPYDPFENVTNAATYNLSPARALSYFGSDIKWVLGTGTLGNSIFYGVISSARTSLLLAVICAAINMTVGILMGAIWGYSKRFDQGMLVVYNIIANIPYILLISVLVYVIGSGFWPFVFALTVTGWLGIAYFFRTQVMIIRDREYSLASRCLGTPVHRVIGKNILPFLTSVIVTLLATELPSYISMEVFLSFIGVGLSASVPSLGRMIQEAQSAFLTFPWAFWPPAIVASVITIILYLLGQNLADASDPRTHM